MTVKDFKKLIADYPDNLPIQFITFKGVENGWNAEEIHIEDISISKEELKNKGTYQVLNILVG